MSDDPKFDAIAAAAELGDLTDVEGSADSPQYVRVLEQEIEQLATLLEQANGRADAAVAEVQHARQRLERDAASGLELRTHKLLRSFLDVLDDLDRAIDAAKTMDHNPEVVHGVELVRRAFVRKLAEHGVTPTNATGERFDPALHEALTTVPVTDPAQAGMVVRVLRQGFLIGDTILRPAGVAVGAKTG